jgi:GH15 family glucan-1,4-alpha-glucosidase
MIYPAMTYIGSNHFSALYGQNDTIIDQKATGVQHLYVDNYEKDLIHTACSVVKVDDTLYYADRVKPRFGHPKRHKSNKSYVIDNCLLVDEFNYKDFNKTDYVGVNEKYIRFKTIARNLSNEVKSFSFSSLAITKPGNHSRVTLNDNLLVYEIEGKFLGIFSSNFSKGHLSKDAPSGFMYRGLEDILFEKNTFKNHTIESTNPLSGSLTYEVVLNPNEVYSYEWIIYIGNSVEDIIEYNNKFIFIEDFKEIRDYWTNYLKNIKTPNVYEEETKTKLVALRGALLDGLLPADLTGHYFANGEVCFYSRDALMGSRAFLYSGLYKEFKSIIKFLLECETKPNGEYYQRYRYDKIADEGANNNVFTQIDFIGYFTRVVTDYYHLTKKMICSFSVLERMINILYQTNIKNGLYGPEGGVNEGVYGPAFIVSTNMFIAGGIKGAMYLADEFNQVELKEKWSSIYNDLQKSIENTFCSDRYCPYGYVTYHDDIIMRYDTPQLLSGSLGYPLSENYRKSYSSLLNKATYFDYGIGYSEQEYHDGPWIFNTAAAASVAYLLDDIDNYNFIMKWLVNHQNGYMMNPEAVDAKNENIPFINPLMWANSEFVVSSYANIIKELRKKS